MLAKEAKAWSELKEKWDTLVKQPLSLVTTMSSEFGMLSRSGTPFVNLKTRMNTWAKDASDEFGVIAKNLDKTVTLYQDVESTTEAAASSASGNGPAGAE